MTRTTLNYKSPSGRIDIEKFVPPFQTVKEGFGFVGLIAKDVETGLIQCHICGEWKDSLSTHLRKHKLESIDYKNKFGLNRTTALKSMKLRVEQSKIMTRSRKNHPEAFVDSSEIGRRRRLQLPSTRGVRRMPESQNKMGTCDLQISEKVLALYKEIGRTPRLYELQARYGRSFSYLIKDRYQHYRHLCTSLSIEAPRDWSGHQPKYTKEYFIEKAISSVKGNGGSVEPQDIFTTGEARAIIRYFGGLNNWRKTMIRELVKQIH